MAISNVIANDELGERVSLHMVLIMLRTCAQLHHEDGGSDDLVLDLHCIAQMSCEQAMTELDARGIRVPSQTCA